MNETNWEDDKWLKDLMEELAAMSFDSLREVVCNGDIDVSQVREMCDKAD